MPPLYPQTPLHLSSLAQNSKFPISFSLSILQAQFFFHAALYGSIRQNNLTRSPPRRIISLVPSQTELLHTLGLEEEVIASQICVHPQQWFRHKTRVGGTKDIRPEVIHSLQPDLIIANKEENDRAQVEHYSPTTPLDQ